MSANHMDNYAMSDAADDWGPEDDPCRPFFIRGWKDFRAGREMDDIQDMAQRAAYLSGWIAARETPVPTYSQGLFIPKLRIPALA